MKKAEKKSKPPSNNVKPSETAIIAVLMVLTNSNTRADKNATRNTRNVESLNSLDKRLMSCI